MEKAGSVRRKFGRYVIGIIIICFTTAGLYYLGSNIFSLKYIEVVGNDVAVTLDNDRIPKNLLFFPTDRIRKEIMSANPLFADIRLEKQYPHTLKIIPIIRVPFVLLTVADRTVVLDKDGFVLMEGDKNSVLPHVYISEGEVKTGKRTEDLSVQTSIAFISAMQSIMPVSWVKQIDALSLQARCQNTDIYITQNKPIQDTLSTLQTLIAGFRIKGKLPAVVDLRFDKPVVTF